jgi:hypothetical protein
MITTVTFRPHLTLHGSEPISHPSNNCTPPEPAFGPSLLDFTAIPAAVRAVAEGERLSFGHLANSAFATEISQIDPLPH